ncbi:MAG: hypothetical protein ABH881_01115 [bacterium]
MQHYAYSFLLYLIITILAESIVVFLILRKILDVRKQSLSNAEIFLAIMFANLLTLPYVWFVSPYLFLNFSIAIWISEIFAFAVEAIFYKIYFKLSFRNAFFISLLANLFSFGLGKLLHNL